MHTWNCTTLTVTLHKPPGTRGCRRNPREAWRNGLLFFTEFSSRQDRGESVTTTTWEQKSIPIIDLINAPNNPLLTSLPTQPKEGDGLVRQVASRKRLHTSALKGPLCRVCSVIRHRSTQGKCCRRAETNLRILYGAGNNVREARPWLVFVT